MNSPGIAPGPRRSLIIISFKCLQKFRDHLVKILTDSDNCGCAQSYRKICKSFVIHCHFEIKGVLSESRSVMSNSLQPHGLYSPWNSPGQNIGVGSLSLLQGIFLTQELSRGLLHCRRILYQLSHQGSPRGVLRRDYSGTC